MFTPTPLHTSLTEHIVCPSCGHDKGFSVSHLRLETANTKTARNFGPWYCNQCGNSIYGRVEADGTVLTEPCPSVKEDRAVLLMTECFDGDLLYLVVKGITITDASKEAITGDKWYFYEEHTCPQNYLRETIAVISDNERGADADPHGIFGYIADIPIKGNEKILGVDGSSNASQNGDEILALFGVQPRSKRW